jgi:hypothetical protein
VAIGNVPSEAELNNQAAQLATTVRQWAYQVLIFQAYVVAQGAAGLEALGFASGDASNMISMADYMATVAQVYQGTATQASEFNFENELSALTGPF